MSSQLPPLNLSLTPKPLVYRDPIIQIAEDFKCPEMQQLLNEANALHNPQQRQACVNYIRTAANQVLQTLRGLRDLTQDDQYIRSEGQKLIFVLQASYREMLGNNAQFQAGALRREQQYAHFAEQSVSPAFTFTTKTSTQTTSPLLNLLKPHAPQSTLDPNLVALNVINRANFLAVECETPTSATTTVSAFVENMLIKGCKLHPKLEEQCKAAKGWLDDTVDAYVQQEAAASQEILPSQTPWGPNEYDVRQNIALASFGATASELAGEVIHAGIKEICTLHPTLENQCRKAKKLLDGTVKEIFQSKTGQKVLASHERIKILIANELHLQHGIPLKLGAKHVNNCTAQYNHSSCLHRYCESR